MASGVINRPTEIMGLSIDANSAKTISFVRNTRYLLCIFGGTNNAFKTTLINVGSTGNVLYKDLLENTNITYNTSTPYQLVINNTVAATLLLYFIPMAARFIMPVEV